MSRWSAFSRPRETRAPGDTPGGADRILEEIETQYCRSVFIGEMCVVPLESATEPGARRFYAVVVPDRALLDRKRIVNVGDLLRFEIEGQSIHLEPARRIEAYEIRFEALPRSATGKLKRGEIEKDVRERLLVKRGQPTGPATVDEDLWSGDHARHAAAIILQHARRGVVTPDANLEIDLGLDSLDRIELVARLEQAFGVRLPTDRAHEILTAGQLIEAMQPGVPRRPARDEAGERTTAWTSLLAEPPDAADSALSGLLARRPIMSRFWFVVSRLIRIGIRVSARGLEHVPASGPYLICPNHQGYLDPFFVCARLPYSVFRQVFFIGAAEYFETPLMRWLARQINLMPVDPDANLVSAMKACAFGLRHGRILLVFPEGERSIDGTVRYFKKGAAILANGLGVPIVPVAVRGAFEIWPRNRAFDWRRLRYWSRHRVRVVFGPPIELDRRADYAESSKRLRATVEEMWNAPDPPGPKS